MIKKIIRIGKKESISVVSEAISSLVEITVYAFFIIVYASLSHAVCI